jgi:hypothetical protein
MSLEAEIDQLKNRAAAIVDAAAHHDKDLSPEEDREVLRLLEQAHLLEHQLARNRRKGVPAVNVH